MQVRRVSTGHDPRGTSHVMRDETLPLKGMEGNFEIALLWAGDQVPSFPADGRPAPCPQYFPSALGYRFTVLTLAPEAEAREAQARLTGEAAAAAMTEIEGRVGSGLFAALEADHPGMHTTDTVDCGVVLQGEVWLELDEGEVVHLKAGDTFVQNGTRHRWSNRGDETALIAVVLIGGEPRG